MQRLHAHQHKNISNSATSSAASPIEFSNLIQLYVSFTVHTDASSLHRLSKCYQLQFNQAQFQRPSTLITPTHAPLVHGHRNYTQPEVHTHSRSTDISLIFSMARLLQPAQEVLTLAFLGVLSDDSSPLLSPLPATATPFGCNTVPHKCIHFTKTMPDFFIYFYPLLSNFSVRP